MKGFNFDWERPSRRRFGATIRNWPEKLRARSTPRAPKAGVTVCDYGSTDSNWDNTSLFDANVYDQLFMMSYHLTASSTGTYANSKLALTGQGAAKAFKNNQIAVGIGTWGDGGPSTVGSKLDRGREPESAVRRINIIPAPSAADRHVEHREPQAGAREDAARARPQHAGDVHVGHDYDATNNLGLHRVMHHYMAVKRDVPDLNLDGKVNATDATTLANNMGTSHTNTGMTTAAQFDAFYLGGNWEKATTTATAS